MTFKSGCRIFIIAIFCLIYVSYCDIFTSVYKLELLAREEHNLFQAFNIYIRSEENLYAVPSALKRFHESAKENIVEDGNEESLGHPIRIFYLMNRIYYDWKNINYTLFQNSNTPPSENKKVFQEYYRNVVEKWENWPTIADLNGTMASILRIWSVYKLKADDILNGNVFGKRSRPMTSKEILQLADYANTSDFFFLEKVLRRKEYDLFRRKDNDEGEVEGDVTDTPDIVDAMQENSDDFFKLCRDEMKTAEEISRLTCFLQKTSIPYYRAKEEVVNFNPRISLFHDVISEKEITEIKAEAVRKLERSRAASGIHRGRLSQTAWISDLKYPDIASKLNKRISMITNLDLTPSTTLTNVEEFQVVNYGTGGLYIPHNDFSGLPVWECTEENQKNVVLREKFSGDRIATWMFYLSNVHAGGATVFPRLKTRIPVVKGAAAFWYNYKRSGKSDERAFHGGCPVAVGSKWVCNKWIKQSGQIFRRRCLLDDEEDDV